LVTESGRRLYRLACARPRPGDGGPGRAGL